MFIPNKGSEVNIKGSIAQWIAQATEVIIPIKSQLMRFIKFSIKAKISIFATMMHNFKNYFFNLA